MIETTYMGMPVVLNEAETDNRAYFEHCARHRYHLQRCHRCELLRYPPTSSCPYCAEPSSRWVPVEGRGTVHSFVEVHHAIQPAFKAHLPYLVLLVDLDLQNGVPGPHDALRVVGNLVDEAGVLAPRNRVESVGIGSRVRMVFSDVADGLSLPQWTVDASAEETSKPWRQPG